MLFNQLALAATAVAFIIVPEISEADEGIFRTLPIEESGEPFEFPPTALEQSIEVPCKQCRGRDTHLKMEFSVEERVRLVLNGFELYPSADPWHGDLMASVVKGNGKEKESRLGYSLAVRPEGMDEDQQLEVIGVELRVIEVGSRFVDGVPPVKVKLVKAPGGDIVIGSINVEGADEQSDSKCSTMWCTVQSLLDDAWKEVKGFKGFKGCGGMRGHGHKGQHSHGHVTLEGSKSPDDFRQGGELPHEGHRYEHEKDRPHHTWARLMKNFTSLFFIPILMGLATGVVVALIAMFISNMVYRIACFIRGQHPEAPEAPQGASFKAADVESHVEEEKAGLMAEQDPPPQYMDEETRN